MLGLSLWFYEAQRSGTLPASNRVAWRGDAHLGDLVPGGWCAAVGCCGMIIHDAI